MGNTFILNEICAQLDCGGVCEEHSDFELEDKPDNVNMERECQSREADIPVSVAPSIFGFLKQKISRIRGRVRHFFESVSQNFKRVLP